MNNPERHLGPRDDREMQRAGWTDDATPLSDTPLVTTSSGTTDSTITHSIACYPPASNRQTLHAAAYIQPETPYLYQSHMAGKQIRHDHLESVIEKGYAPQTDARCGCRDMLDSLLSAALRVELDVGKTPEYLIEHIAAYLDTRSGKTPRFVHADKLRQPSSDPSPVDDVVPDDAHIRQQIHRLIETRDSCNGADI